MRLPYILVASLLLSCVTRAQEGSLVERMESEVRTLVATVDAQAAAAIVKLGGAPPQRADVAIFAEAAFLSEQLLRPHLALAHGVFTAGSAVLVGTPPRVVAAHAAVGDMSRVTVTLPDGREVEAERWGGDADLGIVVFRLPEDVAKELRGVEVEGDWSRLGAGCIAIAADATGREIRFVDVAEQALGTIDVDTTRFALFGSRGSLIGIESAYPPAGSTSTAPARYGWAETERARRAAVLAERALLGYLANAPRQLERRHVAGPVIRRVLDDLESHGAIRTAYLGVVVGDMAGGGVRIDAVVAGSPAAESDELVAGQRVLEVDGVPCTSADVFSRVLAQHRPGEEVELKVLGQGKSTPGVHRVRLAERAAARADLVTAASIGLVAVDLDAGLRRFLSLPEGQQGVVVQEVRPASAAAAAGLRRGDLITHGGGGAVADAEELDAALAAAKGSIELSGVRIVDERGTRVQTRWAGTVKLPDGGG